MEQRLIWFSWQRDGTRDEHQWDFYRKFAAKNVSSLQQSMNIFPGLVSHVHIMAGQNKCKEKVPDVSDPNQNIE